MTGEKEKGRSEIETGLFHLRSQSDRLNLIPAVTYVPTQLPVQYHRLSEA